MEASSAREQRQEVNELLVETFNSILRVEENALKNRLTRGLTISEIHTIHAIGLNGASPMNVVASRLDVTLATLTAAIGKLVTKGFVQRTRCEADRRQVLVSLTKEGRKAYRAHELFPSSNGRCRARWAHSRRRGRIRARSLEGEGVFRASLVRRWYARNDLRKERVGLSPLSFLSKYS